MAYLSNRLRLFGLIQDLQKEAAGMGLSRTAAALEVTSAVAMEELSDARPTETARSPVAQSEAEEEEQT